MKLEYSLSSGGGLRAWFKLNLLIAILIAAPAILILPVITLVLGVFASWSNFLHIIATNLFWTTVYVAATSAMITAALCAFRAIFARHR